MIPVHGSLVVTIVVGLCLAFVLGAVAHRLRISPIVGYLLAGVVVGPFTPGYVANQNLANELAEIGIILLMFGVGLHFSFRELLSVRRIVLPGALSQMAITSMLGIGLGLLLDWNLVAATVLGLSVATASTVVLTRSLQERRILDTERGHIAVGWLIVQDLIMVLALVLLPALAASQSSGSAADNAGGNLGWALAVTVGKVAAFIAVMMLVGRRVVPWLLHYVAHTGSRELFRLAVLAIALGTAYGAAALFGVSFALGAFFAGVILSESQLSQRAAEEAMPLRDAFAVLFFVSVGMLADPGIVLRNPWPLAGALLIIMGGNAVVSFLLVRAFGYPLGTALTIGTSLAQIGEFSFILSGLGIGLGVLPPEGRELVLGGAILSIFFNPLLFTVGERLRLRLEPRPTEPAEVAAIAAAEPDTDLTPTGLNDHTILVGYGRVGGLVGQKLLSTGMPVLVIEERHGPVERARSHGAEVIVGHAADPRVLQAANVSGARKLLIAIPEGFEAGQIAEQARFANPELRIIARAHSDEEVEHLTHHGADATIMGEREIAHRMLDYALGVSELPTRPAEGPSQSPSPVPA